MTRSAGNERIRRDRNEFQDAVRRAASGNWQTILQDCGIDGQYLKDTTGHVRGVAARTVSASTTWKDAVRFSATHRTPQAGDGFDLLQHVHGWSFKTTLHRVADVLGLHPSGRPHISPTPVRTTNGSTVNLEQPIIAKVPLNFGAVVRIESMSTPVSQDGEVLAICVIVGWTISKMTCLSTCYRTRRLATTRKASISARSRPWLREYGISRATWSAFMSRTFTEVERQGRRTRRRCAA